MDYAQHLSIVNGIQAKRQRLEQRRHESLASKAEKLAKVEEAVKQELERIEADESRLNEEERDEAETWRQILMKRQQENLDSPKSVGHTEGTRATVTTKEEPNEPEEATDEQVNGDEGCARPACNESEAPTNSLTAEEEPESIDSASTPPASPESEQSAQATSPRKMRPAEIRKQRKRLRLAIPSKPTGKKEPYHVIHKDFRSITRSPENDCWIELRCYLCGINSTRPQGKFYNGGRGFLQHMHSVHKDAEPDDEDGWYVEDVVERCIYRQVPDEEAEGILRGDVDACDISKIDAANKGLQLSSKGSGKSSKVTCGKSKCAQYYEDDPDDEEIPIRSLKRDANVAKLEEA